MMQIKQWVLMIVVLLSTNTVFGFQQIIVEPFLQQATANSIWVVWETDQGTETTVEYGLSSDSLINIQTGSAIPNVGSSIIHQVKLKGLQPQTKYYYRVVTGGATSEIFDFRTPSESDTGYPVRFAAYSDSQFDANNPNKHSEIINDGIISFVTQEYDPDLTEALDFVVMPGDLVSNGNTHNHWTDHFFGQAKNLYRHIPLYPVTGNHEVDSPLYFRYFNLPTNGTPGFLEHWYYHDCGNVRLIGLDSNPTYRIQEQLDWLDNVLTETTSNEVIDFVFVQLHHPHKSELWTPGEIDYTGDVIERLEQFTSKSGKPSVHFFGHTHGYSRGQSRDHNHLWVNVASGGGNIDYWGEFPNFDYPEFQYTSPEYGFVIVEAESGIEPQFTLKRLSRGNEVVAKDNVLVDKITIRLNNQAPIQPTGAGCAVSGVDLSPELVLLESSPFSDPDSDEHLESHFQVASSQNGFDNPIRDIWNRKENWYSPPGATGSADGYFSIDTVSDSDIEMAEVGGLDPETTYFWRVRYRDDGLAWSEWSTTYSFTTGKSSLGPNLLANAGAELGVAEWTIVDAPLESLLDGECSSGTSPVSGIRYFAIGGVCSGEGPYGEAFQSLDVSDQSNDIDNGVIAANFGGYLKNFNGNDRPEIWLIFKNSEQAEIDQTARLAETTSLWTASSETVDVPVGTRFIEFHMSGTRNAGFDNDSYLDDLHLRLGDNSNQGGIKGDINLDGQVNLLDVAPFVDVLSGGTYQFEADVNCDGVVNLVDVAPFVDLLSGG